MPPAYPPERAPCIYHKKLLRKVLFLQPHIQEAMVDSLEVALIAGALGALIWFIVTPGDGDVFDNFNTTKAEAAVVLTMASVFVHGILSNFQFFPAFLLLGLLTFIVNRCESEARADVPPPPHSSHARPTVLFTDGESS